MDTIFTFIFGLLLRIGIPVAVSAIIFFLLRRMDERWQKEAKVLPVISTQRPCFEVKGCSEEKRKRCPASAQSTIPCWQVFRSKNGLLRQDCLGCEVFHMAPAPVLT